MEGNTGNNIPAMQVAVYVMCGGGFLGRAAAERPGDFYIDDRVSGLPYNRTKIRRAVEALAVAAKASGIDPFHLPEMPHFDGMGVF